jgi:hypothetical protein
MDIPEVKLRRPSDFLDGYMESDDDYIENNLEACIWFLENREYIVYDAVLYKRKCTEMRKFFGWLFHNLLTDSQLDYAEYNGKTLREWGKYYPLEGSDGHSN